MKPLTQEERAELMRAHGACSPNTPNWRPDEELHFCRLAHVAVPRLLAEIEELQRESGAADSLLLDPDYIHELSESHKRDEGQATFSDLVADVSRLTHENKRLQLELDEVDSKPCCDAYEQFDEVVAEKLNAVHAYCDAVHRVLDANEKNTRLLADVRRLREERDFEQHKFSHEDGWVGVDLINTGELPHPDPGDTLGIKNDAWLKEHGA